MGAGVPVDISLLHVRV